MNVSLYATLITSVIPESCDKVEARSSGLRLNVSYSTLTGKRLNPDRITQGTDFTVAITVGNTSGVRDCDNLALTEMIPSGWEIVNDRLYGGEIFQKVLARHSGSRCMHRTKASLYSLP